MTIRSLATPRSRSRAMSRSISACDSRMPCSSGSLAMSFIAMSYQARIT
jgi:hypothetical protein